MRRILIEQARRKQTLKAGAPHERGELPDVAEESHGESLPLGNFIGRMFFAPDSKRVAALGGGVAQVWDVEQAQPVGEAFANITDLAFHPDGHVVAVSRNDGKIVLHDLDSGQQVAELAHDKPLRSVDFDTEGKHLVTQDGENAYLWLNVLTWNNGSTSRARWNCDRTGHCTNQSGIRRGAS